jgi:hypothetical protein
MPAALMLRAATSEGRFSPADPAPHQPAQQAVMLPGGGDDLDSPQRQDVTRVSQRH